MLKIKKSGFLIKASHTFSILFRSKKLTRFFTLKKKLSQLITLRSPKHFNIGKNKIYTVNSKVSNTVFSFKKKMHLNSFLEAQYSWKLFSKKCLKNTYLLPKALTLVYKTKFKIMWLGYWFFL